MRKIRLSNIKVGSTFKYYGAEYIKLEKKNCYTPNVKRVDNGKEFYFNGNFMVEEL